MTVTPMAPRVSLVVGVHCETALVMDALRELWNIVPVDPQLAVQARHCSEEASIPTHSGTVTVKIARSESLPPMMSR